MNESKKPKGGKRPGAGMPKGYKTAKTLSKELAREEARKLIQRHLPRMLNAQVEAACGVAHLMLRNDDGTWQKAPEKMTADEIAAVLNGDQNRFFIATKDPNTQAFNTLAAYALDKPKEQEQDLNVNVVDMAAILRKARARAHARNRKPER